MRNFIIVLFFSLLGGMKSSHAAPLKKEEAHLPSHNLFISQTEIPLHEAITLAEDGEFSFDSPEGQILSSTGTLLKHDKKKILSFYKILLPQLGWHPQKQGGLIFSREQQILLILFPDAPNIPKDQILIVFKIKPKDS